MKNITVEVVEQYEAIRQSAFCNMFDIKCVQKTASKVEMYELASLSLEEYKYLLNNFSKLMKKFGFSQE